MSDFLSKKIQKYSAEVGRRELFKFFWYYCKLQYGIITQKIFFNWDTQKGSKIIFLKEPIEEELDKMMTSFLEKQNIENNIDITKKTGLEHIGYGSFMTNFLNQPVLFTQIKSTFFFSNTKKINKLTITFKAIPKMAINIFVNEMFLKKINISTLDRKIEKITIPPNVLTKNVIKVIIFTDKLWSPKFIDKKFQEIPTGVGIEKMELT